MAKTNSRYIHSQQTFVGVLTECLEYFTLGSHHLPFVLRCFQCALGSHQSVYAREGTRPCSNGGWLFQSTAGIFGPLGQCKARISCPCALLALPKSEISGAPHIIPDNLISAGCRGGGGAHHSRPPAPAVEGPPRAQPLWGVTSHKSPQRQRCRRSQLTCSGKVRFGSLAQLGGKGGGVIR